MTVLQKVNPRHEQRVRLRHVARVAGAIGRQAVVRDIGFRSQLWVTMIVGLLEVAAALVPPLLVFGHTSTVNGWRLGEVIAVTGAAQLLNALLACFVAPNQEKMTSYIREGDLDQLLIRPVPTQLLAAVRWIRPAELWGAAAGLGLIIVGCLRAGLQPSAGEVLVGIAWFVFGFAATALVWLNLGYLAFWIVSAGQVSQLLATVLTAGRYPLTFFPSAIRVLLLSVIPIGFATTVGIDALRGNLGGSLLLPAVPLLIMLAVITRLHWLIGMRRYSSASS